MILEGVVTTIDEKGDCHIAPMGPITDTSITQLLLRPYQTSTTYQNLKRTRSGVFHITDDVLLIAKLITKEAGFHPEIIPAKKIEGNVLTNCCRWYEFKVDSINDESERTEIKANVVHSGKIRDFLGFNRAKHSVIEAAILASRVHILPENEILNQLEQLKEPVQKTAGDQEKEAFDLVVQFVNEQLKLKVRDE